MKLYLAGPMRGYPEYNFPAFHSAAKFLRRQGYEVWSPAEKDEEAGFNPKTDTPKELAYYMKQDIPPLCECDGIALLPGWEKSEGAKNELAVAGMCGLEVRTLWCNPFREWLIEEPSDAPLHSTVAITPKDGPQETILQEAERLVGGDRNKSYGHPKKDFDAIAGMWSCYLGKKYGHAPLCDRDVANLMILVKVAREANAPKRDNLVDIAGYARCAERLEETI